MSRLILGAVASIALMLSAHSATSGEVESKDPIKIALADWAGQLVSAQIMGQLLVKAGYNVEYVPADYLASFVGLQSGDLTVQPEAWNTTTKEALEEGVKSGGVENLGEIGMQAKEDWWYPLYMKEKCPGLPDWKALNDCAEAFSTPETAPKGRYLSGPVTWGGYDEERVQALGLNYEVVRSGTDAALFAELNSAYERKAPILLWVYEPHWAPIMFQGEWVQFPKFEQACYDDPKWGLNKEMKYDCGKPYGPIYKAVWSGMKDKWPKAYAILKAYKFDNATMGELSGRVDLQAETPEAVAADWIANNEATWKAWMPK